MEPVKFAHVEPGIFLVRRTLNIQLSTKDLFTKFYLEYKAFSDQSLTSQSSNTKPNKLAVIPGEQMTFQNAVSIVPTGSKYLQYCS